MVRYTINNTGAILMKEKQKKERPSILTQHITVRFTDSEYQTIRGISFVKHMPMSSVIRSILIKYLEKDISKESVQ